MSDHNLADQSPEAREIQEAKLEADNHSKVGASATELAAQQNAIKSETNHDQLADQSPQAREIQDAKVEAMRNDQQTATPSSKELAAQQNAIQAESNHDTLADQSPQAREIQEAKADAKVNKQILILITISMYLTKKLLWHNLLLKKNHLYQIHLKLKNNQHKHLMLIN